MLKIINYSFITETRLFIKFWSSIIVFVTMDNIVSNCRIEGKPLNNLLDGD